MQTSSETIRGAKIIAISILCGFSLLGFIASWISKSEEIAIFSAVVGLGFGYILIGQWFKIQPIRRAISWIAKYDPVEKAVDKAPRDSKKSE